MSGAEPYRRHDWAWVERAAPLPDFQEVRRHQEAGLPFIVCRPSGPSRMDRVCLGLALPDKRRLGFHAEVAAISRHRPPLALGEVLNAVPQSWLPRVTLLASRLEEVGLEARVYGSTAWQAMTGTTYLREDSDLDLLLTPATAEQLRLLSGILAAMEGAHPRVDGEIVLADGSAVAWREAASGSTTLLVKSLAGVALVPRAAWLSALREPAHA